MRHVLLIGSFGGSLISFRLDLIKSLIKKGCKVSTLAPGVSEKDKILLDNLGIKHYDLELHRNKITPISDLILIIKLFLLIKNIKPTQILTYTIKPNIWGAIAAALNNTPSFMMVTGVGIMFYDTKKSSLTKRLVKFLYTYAVSLSTGVIFQNRDDQELFQKLNIFKHNDNSCVILGSGINTDIYRRSSSYIFLPITILTAARLLKSKGIEELTTAARSITKKRSDINFILAGDTDSGADSIDLNLLYYWNSVQMQYIGFQENMYDLYSSSTIYVLPSYREGLPRSSLEAMAMGLPIITTDVPGCRETVVNSVNGYLIKPNNALDLEKSIMALVDDHTKDLQKMGQESRRMAVEKFEVKIINRKILEVLGI
jgi:glycosyltransferase involved in cell wall biosynthesis